MWFILSHLGALIGEGIDMVLIAVGAALVLASYGSGIAAIASGGLAGLLAGPIGKVLRWGGFALILVGGCRLYVAREIAAHDAQQTAAAQAAVAKAQADFYQRGAAAAAAQAAADVAQAKATERVRTVILHEKATPSCRNTPAFAAVDRELRRRAADAGKAAAAR